MKIKRLVWLCILIWIFVFLTQYCNGNCIAGTMNFFFFMILTHAVLPLIGAIDLGKQKSYLRVVGVVFLPPPDLGYRSYSASAT